ncbi:peptidase C14 caspase catalytic subunit p20 [Pseudofrankia inefficax]|uniref:Peptidase C14 caspase catalytic subunit p20 n=2 Tax=Pseudofrankia inefficax (strain DSM 45817 / CECT 9037 / DDB 130130 / EuI1c) TaxID=298654 RepID=E3J1F3_PSEI1|nr:peptidase C14 caspase catalytic subunit p20 [Pseudofrankia inefficax]
MPAAANSLDRIKNLLTGPLCGWPSEKVDVFLNENALGDLSFKLAKMIVETSDVLFFYYVGHGQSTLNEDLCMGLVDTSADPVEREFSGLLMAAIRRMLSHSRARVRVIVLDCCFSGIATENRQGNSDEAEYFADIAKVSGAYTLTASEAHAPARYEAGPSPLTQFTKNFCDLIQHGIPGEPLPLTLNLIFPHLRDRLLEQSLPAPTQLNIDRGSSFVFARNAVSPELRFDPRVEVERLRIALREAQERESELRNTANDLMNELNKLRSRSSSSQDRRDLSKAEVDRNEGNGKPDSDTWDFFVSYTGADLQWAEWVAAVLEDAGYRVLIQAWDFVVGSNWQLQMLHGIRSSARMIALLSSSYLSSVYGQSEWQATLRADPDGIQRKLLPVRIEDCPRPGLLDTIVSLDLFGLDEDAARRRLLQAVAGAVSGRVKPSEKPKFPFR